MQQKLDSRLFAALQTLYSKSETFRNSYNKLAEKTNANGQNLYVIFRVISANFPGNTQSQDCTMLEDVNVLIFENGNYSNDVLKKGKNVQAIIITIDYDKIKSRKLNLIEVIAEEVTHADKAADMGTDKWNKRAEKENKLPYLEREEEIRAKKIVKKY